MSLSTRASTQSARIDPLSIKLGFTFHCAFNSKARFSCRLSVNTAFVTVQLPVSVSIQSLAQAPLISVPTVPVDVVVTVIALVTLSLPLVIINLSVLRTTVSSPPVAALIAVCIIAATSSISVTPVKSIASILYAVQSIVILKLQSVTASHTAKSPSAPVHPVKNAGVYK